MRSALFLLVMGVPCFGASIFLDFDTPATGSEIIGTPFVTGLGTVTAVDAALVPATSDPDLEAAGGAENGITHLGLPYVGQLLFDFDVSSITLIYGGNGGDITIRVRDASNAIVDSFYQGSTEDGEPAGPIVLSGAGIRLIEWFETTGGYAPLDNLTIEASEVPEPATAGMIASAAACLALRRLRR